MIFGNQRSIANIFFCFPCTILVTKTSPLDKVHRLFNFVFWGITKLCSFSSGLLRNCRHHSNPADRLQLRLAVWTMPDPCWKPLQRRLQALKTIHGVAMITKNHLVIRRSTLPVALTTSVFPRPSLWICPAKISLTEFQDPSMV